MTDPTLSEEAAIATRAMEFARAHKKEIANRLTDLTIYPNEDHPVSVFMAGSPGAGKTEASIELLETFASDRIIRIDPDELRSEFPEYTGGNAYLFQGAVSTLVNRIHDKVLEQSQSFLLDGTLSHYEVACRNVERSIRKGRLVQVLYVYQDPLLAWSFVKQREEAEGRRILREDFIEQYFSAREVVNRLKRECGKEVRIDLLMKNMDNSRRWYRNGVDQIDNHIPENYTRADLERVLPLLSE